MDYTLWFNKCKVTSTLVERLSEDRFVDLVRFLAWSGDPAIRLDHSTCSCDRCKHDPSFVLLRCSERCLDIALDAEPVLVQRTRHSDECSSNTFVHYSFAHPSILNRDALSRIVSYAGVNLVYVCTTLDVASDTEDMSVFKINLVKHKTPGYAKDTAWMIERIRAATFCRPVNFEIRHVTCFTPFTGSRDRRAGGRHRGRRRIVVTTAIPHGGTLRWSRR